MIETLLQQRLERIQNLQDLAAHLELLQNSGSYVWEQPNGERLLVQGRVLVERIHGLKIHIYADEHAPPHFHVVSSDIDAAFRIDDCALLKGSIDRKARDLIVYWHESARHKLIKIWNRTRPTNCPVGPIQEYREHRERRPM